MTRARVAIIGAGLGGTAAAILLHRLGFTVTIYEQAMSFGRIGAGIHLSPNVTRIFDRLGILRRMREIGVQPSGWISRAWDTGEVTLDLRLGEAAEARYGAPYMIMHRGDFHALLIDAVPAGLVAFGKRLVDLEPAAANVKLRFEDGSSTEADLVIGADGVNSRVREILLGPELPKYTGYIAHRSIFPMSRLGDLKLDDCSKWWSDTRHIVVYFITQQRQELYFVTGVPCADWPDGVISMPGDVDELIADFEGFEPRVQRIVRSCHEVSKWAILERDPLPFWRDGRIVLLGDACHPMRPHMGQGAAMAIEDAAMLARCFEGLKPADFELAFRLYQTNRLERTAKVQRHSRFEAEWLRRDLNPDWVFGYNVFEEPLLSPAVPA